MVACMEEHRHEAETLARVVLDRRCELGMTQAQLAEKASVAHRTVQNIEAGRRPMPLILAAVARALEMDAAELQRIADSQPQQAAS